MLRAKRLRPVLLVGAVFCAGAAAVLCLLFDPQPKLSRVLRDLRDPSPLVQLQAQESLRQMGSNSIPALKRRLHAHDWPGTTNLVRLLQCQSIIKVSFVPARERRIRAGIGCAVLGPTAVDALPDLIAFSKEDHFCWNLSQSALSQLGPEAVGPLCRTLTSPELKLRLLAAGALAHIGPGLTEATPALIKCMNDPSSGVRSEIARALGRVDPVSLPVVRALTMALEDRDGNVRGMVELSLEGFGEAARPHLLSLQNDSNMSVRTNAMKILNTLPATTAVAHEASTR